MVVEHLLLGLDFGTDSVRALIVNTLTGKEEASDVSYYSRWSAGDYSDPGNNQFRQHPFDYLEAMQASVKGALVQLPPGTGDMIFGIGIDTTGSTPCAVSISGKPLAMEDGFENNPNAMFILWKDHTAIAEADEITKTSKRWGGADYTLYSGGTYSAEWFWAKALHILRVDQKVAEAAHTWIELCDWLPAILTATPNMLAVKRSRCAAGHKAMWHEKWGGWPCDAYLSLLDSALVSYRSQFRKITYTADWKAGELCEEWAEKLNLNKGISVAVGALDAHMGAVGGGICPGSLLKITGTSTCDIIVSSADSLPKEPIEGICGQVDGSVIPGLIGLEAGQSAFGDIYSWFRELLSWPFARMMISSYSGFNEQVNNIINDTKSKIIDELTKDACRIAPGSGTLLALDWFNGRRTPFANQHLAGAITGITLGVTAPAIFRTLIEATAFGAKAIINHFIKKGIRVDEIIALGGIAKRNTLVMQIIADVLGMPVKVVRSEQACALGAVIFASVAAGIYSDVQEAQAHLCSGFDQTYYPVEENVEVYKSLYFAYKKLAGQIEGM